MSSSNIGRNAPCPCGSGKKYKHCCLNKERDQAPHNPAREANQALREAMAGQDFESLDDIQAFAEQFMGQRNRAPQDEFHGLSPEQMYDLLHRPFDSPHLLRFTDPLNVEPEAPVIILFNRLAEAIGDKGLKPTATGNLPRNLCREIAQDYWGPERYAHETRFGNINQEPDFGELHVTRLIAELAGLIRKYKGRFILSREARNRIGENGTAGIYPPLLKTHVQKYNWSYQDSAPELFIVQQSFAFTLYLLRLYGEKEQPTTFYETAFINAFPAALQEAGQSPYAGSPEVELAHCYTMRALERFLPFFGLADVVPVSDDPLNQEFRVTRRPLLNEVVQFQIS